MDFQKIKMLANQVRDEQVVYRPDWEDILYYCSSAKTLNNIASGMTTTPSSGQKQFKFDNTAQDACEDSANYLYQMCIGNIDTGFFIDIDNNKDEVNKRFKEYLRSDDSCFQETMRNYFHESRLLGNVGIGNFINKTTKKPYVDIFTMDTAAFQRANQSKIWVMVDDRSYPVYELIEMFGEDAIPDQIKGRYKSDPLCRHNLKTMFLPNERYEEKTIGQNGQKIKMIRFFDESQEPITTDYLENMPEFVSLNRTNREIYSRAPAQKVLNIIKALNRLVESSMYGFTQLNNPTTLLMINNAFKDLKIRKVPGGIIPMKMPGSGQMGQVQQSLQTIQDTGNTFAILKEYFTNLILHAWRTDEFFQAIQHNMTATQASIIDQRTKSFLIAEIEPHKIVVNNVIKRLFQDTWKVGLYAGLELDKESVYKANLKWNNYMALQEKQAALTNINEFLQYSAALLQRNPQIGAAIDDFNLLLDIAEATGQSDKIATEDEYGAVQKATAAAATQNTQLEAGLKQSEIAKNIGAAQKDSA
jgi:hypothetical protein